MRERTYRRAPRSPRVGEGVPIRSHAGDERLRTGRAPTCTCSRSRVNAAPSAPAVTPNGCRSGRSGSTPHFSHRYRTGRWYSPSPCGCARTASIAAVIRTLTGVRDFAVWIVARLKTLGSRTNRHPHLHLLVIHGGFRRPRQWRLRELGCSSTTVHVLHPGLGKRAIADQLGVCRRTVHHWRSTGQLSRVVKVEGIRMTAAGSQKFSRLRAPFFKRLATLLARSAERLFGDEKEATSLETKSWPHPLCRRAPKVRSPPTPHDARRRDPTGLLPAQSLQFLLVKVCNACWC